MRRLLIALAIALPLAAQQRLATDFEIAQMEKQLARGGGFESQLSGRLNLGDARAARNERSLARAEYAKALELATRERLDARRDSNMTRYANATSYAALAQAKLGREAEAFALLEESTRYTSDDPETWNLYASAMRILGKPRKSVAAARNAVTLAKTPLDAAIYQHALATALMDSDQLDEAERLLVAVTRSLRSEKFAPLARDVARQEAFEVYSSARGDVAAYVSLLNRAQLRLASLYEQRGATDKARIEYEHVLEGRSDDVTALAALARLARNDEERERRFDEAFAANPFAMTLVRQYETFAKDKDVHPSTDMQRAIAHLARGEHRAARELLDTLLAKFPENETLRTLRREAESAKVVLPSADPAASELAALIDAFEQLTPDERAALDQATFASEVVFDGERGNTFASGTIGGVPFRFSEPIVFAGTFDPRSRLTYRILGITRSGERDALLLEPLKLEPSR